jgi:hypothetical protein
LRVAMPKSVMKPTSEATDSVRPRRDVARLRSSLER